MAEEEVPAGQDVRFCPYCFSMSFQMSEVKGEFVFCEMCGVDVEVKELVRPL